MAQNAKSLLALHEELLPAERQAIENLVGETKLRTVNWMEVPTVVQESCPEAH